MTEAGAIPNSAHFVWFGSDLDWACALSIRAALLRGGFEHAVLHHESQLSNAPCFESLARLPGLELRSLDERAQLARLEAEGGPALIDIYDDLVSPAARANLMRAAILWLEGGVYLDLDAIAVRDMGGLRQRCGAFFGIETVTRAEHSAGGARPVSGARRLALRALRTTLRLAPWGWRHVRSVEHLYPHAANNAVLAATPRHPLIARLLRAMSDLPSDQRRVQFALGTHLLQRVAAEYVEPDVEILSPAVLYPLGPVFSEHWFRMRRRIPPLREVLGPDALVVHWYASGHVAALLPHIDEAWVRAHRDRQLFSRLACGVLDGDLDL